MYKKETKAISKIVKELEKLRCWPEYGDSPSACDRFTIMCQKRVLKCVEELLGLKND